MEKGDKVIVYSKPNHIKMYEGIVDNSHIEVTWAYGGSSINVGDTLAISEDYIFDVDIPLEAPKTPQIGSEDIEVKEVTPRPIEGLKDGNMKRRRRNK